MRRWLVRSAVTAIAIPLAAAGARRAADAIEARRGASRMTKGLRWVAARGRRR